MDMGLLTKHLKIRPEKIKMHKVKMFKTNTVDSLVSACMQTFAKPRKEVSGFAC